MDVLEIEASKHPRLHAACVSACIARGLTPGPFEMTDRIDIDMLEAGMHENGDRRSIDYARRMIAQHADGIISYCPDLPPMASNDLPPVRSMKSMTADDVRMTDRLEGILASMPLWRRGADMKMLGLPDDATPSDVDHISTALRILVTSNDAHRNGCLIVTLEKSCTRVDHRLKAKDVTTLVALGLNPLELAALAMCGLGRVIFERTRDGLVGVDMTIETRTIVTQYLFDKDIVWSAGKVTLPGNAIPATVATAVTGRPLDHLMSNVHMRNRPQTITHIAVKDDRTIVSTHEPDIDLPFAEIARMLGELP